MNDKFIKKNEKIFNTKYKELSLKFFENLIFYFEVNNFLFIIL
jgi:hypothetical protein